MYIQAFLLPAGCGLQKKETGVHDVRLRFIHGTGEELMKPIEAQMNIVSPKNGQYSTLNLVFNFTQVKFDKAGRYSFELYIDDEWISGLPLFVNQL